MRELTTGGGRQTTGDLPLDEVKAAAVEPPSDRQVHCSLLNMSILARIIKIIIIIIIIIYKYTI